MKGQNKHFFSKFTVKMQNNLFCSLITERYSIKTENEIASQIMTQQTPTRIVTCVMGFLLFLLQVENGDIIIQSGYLN